jgi:hypothetical protein
MESYLLVSKGTNPTTQYQGFETKKSAPDSTQTAANEKAAQPWLSQETNRKERGTCTPWHRPLGAGTGVARVQVRTPSQKVFLCGLRGLSGSKSCLILI